MEKLLTSIAKWLEDDITQTQPYRDMYSVAKNGLE